MFRASISLADPGGPEISRTWFGFIPPDKSWSSGAQPVENTPCVVASLAADWLKDIENPSVDDLCEIFNNRIESSGAKFRAISDLLSSDLR